VKDRAYDAINGAHFVWRCIDMMDQVTNASLEIIVVVAMRGDTQAHILADPSEVAGIAVWNTRQ